MDNNPNPDPNNNMNPEPQVGPDPNAGGMNPEMPAQPEMQNQPTPEAPQPAPAPVEPAPAPPQNFGPAPAQPGMPSDQIGFGGAPAPMPSAAPKNNKGLLIGIIVGIAVLIVGAVLLFVFVLGGNNDRKWLVDKCVEQGGTRVSCDREIDELVEDCKAWESSYWSMMSMGLGFLGATWTEGQPTDDSSCLKFYRFLLEEAEGMGMDIWN